MRPARLFNRDHTIQKRFRVRVRVRVRVNNLYEQRWIRVDSILPPGETGRLPGIRLTCFITTFNVANMFLCPYPWKETVYLKVISVLYFPVTSSSQEIMVTFCITMWQTVLSTHTSREKRCILSPLMSSNFLLKTSILRAYSNGPPYMVQTTRGDSRRRSV